MRELPDFQELRRFGFGENFTAMLGLVEEMVKHLVKTLEETKGSEEHVAICFKSEPPKTINVRRTWKEEACEAM